MKKISLIILPVILILSIACDNYFDDMEMQNKLTEGLVAYWPVTESSGTVVKYWSGNDVDLTMTSGTYSNGKFGKSILCESVTAIQVNKDNYFFQNDEFTISMWINPDYNGEPIFETSPDILSINQLVDSVDVTITGRDDQIRTLVSIPNDVFEIENWSYLTSTNDGNVVSIYLNGVLVASSGYTFGIKSGINSINFANSSWKGQLDEIRIYNRALGQEEIKALMEIGVD